MIDYRTPVGDILFTLRAAADAERLPGYEAELASDILGAAARFVDAVVAPLDPVGDAQGVRLVDGRARMPEAFVSAYAAHRDGGWAGLAVAERFGGQELPHVLAAAVSEMLAGACISFQMILTLAQGAMRTLAASGSAEQRALWIPRLASGEWLASMCLTEPQAGSDLGLVTTTARPDAEGWRLDGSKIFISGGDQDMTGRVLHLVLARTPGAPAGVKGLSLFLCPSELEDGRRNAVSVVRLEDKMGMHASPTCQLAFDGAVGEIVGAPGEGLARMFTMMNFERLEVAVQGVGLAEVAGQRARHHAAARRQGKAAGVEGAAPIDRHADVRRMLLTQAALALGCRAMVYRAAVEEELGARPDLVDFLTPVCKALATDAAVETAHLAIQVHGGYGYLREYRVEQILRDARITQIYEGTNGIQAMTLAGRLLPAGRGTDAFARDVEDAAAVAEAAGCRDTAASLADALSVWREASEVVRRIADPGFAAAGYLRLTGLVAFATAWARLEAAAAQAPAPERIRALAAFVRRHMLPEVHHLARGCGEATAPDDFADALTMA
ncbi:acyl-CoA dehydrogenase family protein [Azospirillum sp. sgz301742]